MTRYIIFISLICLALFEARTWAQGDWEQSNQPNPPPARYGATMVTMPDGQVYMFGGEGDTLFNDLFVANNQLWRVEAPGNSPPRARRDHTAWVNTGTTMWIAGGYGDTAPLDDMWSYNTNTKLWIEEHVEGVKPAARYGHSVTPLPDGSILFFGGTDAIGLVRSDLWKFNPDNHTYTQLPSSAYHYTHHAVQLVDNNYMFVFGIPNVISIYDVAASTWIIAQAGPLVGRYASSAMTQNDRGETVILIFGGLDINGEESSAVYEFNTTTGQVSQRPSSMPLPLIRSSASVVPSSQQAMRTIEPTDKMALSEVLNCTTVAAVEPQAPELRMIFFGGISGGQVVQTSLCFYSNGVPPPPPVGKEVSGQIAALGHGRFALFLTQFPQAQAELNLKIQWEPADAKLCLLAMALPACEDTDATMDDGDAFVNFSMRKLDDFETIHPTMKRCHHKDKKHKKNKTPEPDPEPVIEKNFTNVKVLVLLIKHHTCSPTARNIQFVLTKMEQNPNKALYVFPVGAFKPKEEERIHFLHFAVEPVRWKSWYPKGAKVEETGKPGPNYWEWYAIDRTEHRSIGFHKLAFVKFELP